MTVLHIADNFYDFVTELNASEIKQIQKAIKLIKADPVHVGLRRHKLDRIKSKNIVSYSPNRDIRIIAFEPDPENTFLLYVNHHDIAYNWAKNRKIDRSSISKVISIVKISESERPETVSADESEVATENLKAIESILPDRKKGDNYLFDAFTESELGSEGISSSYLTLVRKVRTEDDVCFLVDKVPSAISEAVFSLAGELSIEESPQLKESTATKANTADELPAQKEIISYQSLETDNDLDEWISALDLALDKDFENWRLFLHPIQRKAVVANSKGPIRVTGGAGTGKTVVGLHRAKYLAENQFKKAQFITYNRTLMSNLSTLAKSLFASNESRKYSVNTFHEFVINRLKSENCEIPKFKIKPSEFLAPGLALFDPTALGSSWTPATIAVVFREIVSIIAPQRIKSLKTYVRAKRAGMGKTLSISQKEEIWKVYEKAWEVAKTQLVMPYDLASHYALSLDLPPLQGEALIVDEVQDLSSSDLAFLGSQAPGANQLTLLEDAKQRIYGPGYSLKALGINVVGRRSIKLFVNYRTTEQIGDHAAAAISDLGFSKIDIPIALRKDEKSVVSKKFTDQVDEFEWIVDQIHDCQQRQVEPIAVLGRSRKILDELGDFLDSAGVEFIPLDDRGTLSKPGHVKLCTMHSAKGLEFRSVFVCGLNYDVNNPRIPSDLVGNSHLETDFVRREKQLQYVAFSRARDELYVSGRKV